MRGNLDRLCSGAAGDAVAKRLGDRGMLATDLMDALPVVIKSIVSYTCAAHNFH